MGRMSKQKGKRGEREAAAELGSLLGCHARRGVQYQGSTDSPDVVLEGVNVHVECKRSETINVYKALEQATGDAGQKVPIVWHRRNGKPSVVIIETARLAEFIIETHKSLENKGETFAKCEKAKKKPAQNAVNEKHAYFPRKTHKNTKNMRFSSEKQGLLQNATLPPQGGVLG